MQEDIITKILTTLDSNLKDKGSYIQFNNQNYKPIKLSKDNFHEIKETKTNQKIAFIDGGNSEILAASNFSLQLIRVYYTIYQYNKRISSKKHEFYVLINSVNEEYQTQIFPINYDFNNLAFNSFDSTLKQGNNKIKPSKIGEIIRKLAEIKIAEELIDILTDKDIIVRDGDLKSSATYEKEYFENLYKKALEKNITVTALSKTSELFTETGNSLLAAINEIAPENEWYYHPLVEITDENHKSDLYIVKLNKNSKYIFKFEVFKNNSYDISDILTLLKNNSVDPVFLGYPYGLIEADKFARVANNEINTLKLQFLTKAGEKAKLIKQYLNTKNAHDILDNI